jgi:hypothetical protein
MWRVVGVGDAVQLVNVGSGKAIDVPGQSTSPGTQLIQWSSHSGANQLWTLSPVDAGFATLTSRSSGMLVDVSNNSGDDGAAIIQWPAHGGLNQHWQLVSS